jgi:3-isopropylmalate/(R)-2-methylmalate dehydratase small subunit
MEPITRVTGTGVPLKRSNVDTDQIVPSQFLKRVTKTGFEDALFFQWRKDPAFFVNQPVYEGATVLVAGPDFGTGSSREHAVWALRDYGFRAVLSPRFGDIFRGNSGKQGLLTGIVTEDDVERLWAAMDAEPGLDLTVDLVERIATAPGLTRSTNTLGGGSSRGSTTSPSPSGTRTPSPPSNTTGPHGARVHCRPGRQLWRTE